MLLPANQIVPSLELNHRSARELYEQVGRTADIHVNFNPAGFHAGGVDSTAAACPDCIWVTVRDSLLEGTLDAVARATHTSWQAVSSDTIYVTRGSGPEPGLQSAREPASSSYNIEGLSPNDPLRAAIRAGKFADVVLLIVKGANVSQVNPSGGRGFLHDVCALGHADLIPLLVEIGADPMQRDRFGQTPLSLALEYKNEKAAAALLQLAGPHQQMLTAASEVMDDASVRGYTEIARILLDQGVDPNQLTSQGGTYLHDAALGGSVDVVMAAEMGHLEAARTLLKGGANALLKDNAGRNASDRAKETGSIQILPLFP